MSQINAAPEAIRFLTERRTLTMGEFLSLPDEARMRAFTVARQTETQILQGTLDALGQHLETGGTQATFREKFPEIVKPFTEAGSEWHLRLIVDQNVRQAQAVGAYAQRQRMKATFPYVEYQTGINPRPTHKALDKRIFAVDDPFLLAHTPPWEFGCNCDLVPRTSGQANRVRADDQGKPVEQQRVVTGNSKLESLAAQNKMPSPTSGALHPVDMRPPNLKADGGDYSFRPDRLNQVIDLAPYDADLRTRLAGRLRDLGYQVSTDGMTATPVLPVKPLKSSRIGKPVQPLGRILACKPRFPPAGGVTAASGARWGLDRLGRPVGRIASPAPQIARIQEAA